MKERLNRRPSGAVLAGMLLASAAVVAPRQADASCVPNCPPPGVTSWTTSFAGAQPGSDPLLLLGRAVAQAPDGRVVAAGFGGASGSVGILLARYLSQSTKLDTSFSGDGRQVVALTGPYLRFAGFSAEALAVQSDGKIVVAGKAWVPKPMEDSDFLVLRLKEDGSLDPTFDGDGIRVLSLGGTKEEARAVAVQPDGRIIVAGWPRKIARLNSTGSLDPTFGSGGVVTSGGGPGAYAFDVAVQKDLQVVVAGASDTLHRAVVSRYSQSGVPVMSATAYYDPLAADGAYGPTSVALGPKGTVLVAGLFDNEDNVFHRRMGVIRFKADGLPDGSFSGDGRLTADVGGDTLHLGSIDVQADGKIVVFGTAWTGAEARFAFARFA